MHVHDMHIVAYALLLTTDCKLQGVSPYKESGAYRVHAMNCNDILIETLYDKDRVGSRRYNSLLEDTFCNKFFIYWSGEMPR